MKNIHDQYIKLLQPEVLWVQLHGKDANTPFGAEYADSMTWVIAEPPGASLIHDLGGRRVHLRK